MEHASAESLNTSVTLAIPQTDESRAEPLLPEQLARHASDHPNRASLRFVESHRQRTEVLGFTAAELDRCARAAAAMLQGIAEPGDRVLLVYPPGPDFTIAFLGCLYAGMIAVPVHFPWQRRHIDAARSFWRDAGCRVALSAPRNRVIAELYDAITAEGEVRWLETGEWPVGAEHLFRRFDPEPGTVAYLQYTSGSTGDPKGVVITHSCVMANIAAIVERWAITPNDRMLTWAPPHHDMGLVGGILVPLVIGCQASFLQSMDVLQRPARWLRAVSEARATVSGGAAFGFQLCLDRIAADELDGVDLSSWQVAYCGAEPVSLDVVEGFARKFEPWGFEARALEPAYGLAESTVLATGNERGSGVRAVRVARDELGAGQAVLTDDAASGVELVAIGRALSDIDLRVVDDEGAECADGYVGEVWLRGSSIAAGYWSRPERTREIFEARLQETPGLAEAPSGDRGFLRTGDLGFVHAGQLYLCGRRSEVLNVRGAHHFPQDLLQTAQSVDAALATSRGVAFESDDCVGVVLALEIALGSDGSSLAEHIATRVAADHGLAVRAVVLVPPGRLPVTRSGKLDVSAARVAYTERALATVACWEPVQ